MDSVKSVCVIDFCDTVVFRQTHDDFIFRYLIYKKRRLHVCHFFFLKSWPALLFFKLLGSSPKTKVLYLLRGEKMQDLVDFSYYYAEMLIGLRHNKMIEILIDRSKKHRIAIISGGLSIYIRAFFEKMQLSDCLSIVANELEESDGFVTGLYTSKDCMGPEKVRRLLMEFGDGIDIAEVYSDCRSDMPLFSLANKAFLVKGEGQLYDIT